MGGSDSAKVFGRSGWSGDFALQPRRNSDGIAFLREMEYLQSVNENNEQRTKCVKRTRCE